MIIFCEWGRENDKIKEIKATKTPRMILGRKGIKMTINEFAECYACVEATRLHMPGHKGVSIHGMEKFDITEIDGADSLYEANGIILESEQRTSEHFGSQKTCYSAEGSSLSIKASLAIIRQYIGRDITVAAPRNCHRAFISGCALLGIDVEWIYPDSPTSLLCECAISPAAVEKCLKENDIDAVYITSPDYIGNMADIEGIAAVCRRHGAFLICDNAHGAYLKFLERSKHPLDLGADIVCDSAHKTLPVYTGGAYLHIAGSAPKEFCGLAKPAMAMFGSTSPSYLIMESLDKCGIMLKSSLPERIRECCKRVSGLKKHMAEYGMRNLSAEPMKITIDAENYGYDGRELADMMRRYTIECEYADPYVIVLMFSPYNSEQDYERLNNFICEIPKQEPTDVKNHAAALPRAEKAMSIRSAMLAKAQRIPVDESEGRICARSAMSCQPSIAVVMSGEKISRDIIKILKNYSIFEIDVI